MNKVYVILSIIACLFSCDSENQSLERVVLEFPESKTLTWKSHTISTDIFQPHALFVANDHLIVYKDKQEYLFDLYSVEPFRYLYSAGQRGGGPNDFVRLDVRSFIPTTKGFSAVESGVQLKDVEIGKNALNITSSEQLFKESGPSNGFYHLENDTYLMFGNIGSQNEFILFDKKNKTEKEIGEYPAWTKKDKPFEMFVSGIKNCVVHPNGHLFASFYGRKKHLRIYKSDGELLRDISVDIEPYTNTVKSLKPEELGYYYLSPNATSKHIYVLCMNQKNASSVRIPELQVWDWEGNPVASYTLDKEVSLLALSEEANMIFAIDHKIENKIYYHEMPY